MFKTITMVRLYLKQQYFNDALNIINELLSKDTNNKDELLLLKAMALEGLDKNNEAENILFDLMQKGIINNDISELLQKIYNKTGREEKIVNIHIPLEEIAMVYEKLGDIEMAVKYYKLKIEELQNQTKISNNKN